MTKNAVSIETGSKTENKIEKSKGVKQKWQKGN